MKRVCNLCLGEFQYGNVTKHKHGLNLCSKCENVILNIALQLN